MIPRNLIVAAAVAGVVGGAWTVWKKFRTPLEQKPMSVRHLPGFSIAIPEDSTEKVATLDYGAGKLEVANLGRTGASLHVVWQFGEVPDAAGVLEIGRIAAKAAGADGVHAITGTEGRTLAIGSEGRGFMSITSCGTRLIMMMTMSAGRAAHQKIVDSIDCHPDPARENTPATSPLAIDLPDFETVERVPGQITIESPTARVVMRRQAGNNSVGMISQKLGNDFLKAIGIDGALGPRHGDILTFTATFDDVAQPGLVRFMSCPDSTVVVLAIAVDMDASNDVEKRIAAAHCLAPGETAPSWPDAPPVP